MDAKELSRIKLLLHGLHRLVQQVSSPLAADLYVISSRANPVDVLCADDLNPEPILTGKCVTGLGDSRCRNCESRSAICNLES